MVKKSKLSKVEQIDQDILDTRSRIAEMQERQQEIEIAIAETWNGNHTKLEQEYASLTARIKAADRRIDTLQEQRGQAETDALITRYGKMVQDRDKLIAAHHVAKDKLQEAQDALKAAQDEANQTHKAYSIAAMQIRQVEEQLTRLGIDGVEQTQIRQKASKRAS